MTVIVYSLTNCQKCAGAKAVLKRKGISYEEKNIETSEDNKKEMMAKFEQAGLMDEGINMPVLDIEGAILEGFNKERMLTALKEKGLAE